jgi:hypothetical protein
MIFAWWCGVSLSAFGVTFTTSLDRATAVVGEPVTLTLSFDGGTPQEVSSLPQIDGIQVASGISSSVNSTLGPDGMTTVQTYTVTLVPTRVGEFVIPAFQARVNGEQLSSQPLTLKVAASDPAAPPADFAGRAAFLWPVLPKKELFVGEPMIAEFRLYIRSEIRNSRNLQIPLSGDGFTFSKFVEGQHFQRRVGAASFTVVPLLVAVTPVKTGKLVIGPVNGSITINAHDRFDLESLFGSPAAPQQVPLPLAAITLPVLPLPSENVPADFNGAVGTFLMTLSAGPTNVAVGDPITVKIQITGKGPLDALTLPEQPAWHDFKTYPPTTKVEPRDQFGVSGTKYFEQVVVPQNTDIKTLPPVSFSYFDPDQKSYRTVVQAAVPLAIRPGGSTPAPTVAIARGAADNAPASQDIVPIKQRAGALAQMAPPLIQRPWFLAWQCVPMLAFLSTVAWRKRSEALANNPRRRRQRQVAQIIHQGLNQLRKSARENNSDEFFATLFRLLQERLGERLDLPATAITEAVIEDRLRPRGVPEPALTALHELFQTCNQARYAPIKSSQELAAFVPKVESIFKNLEAIPA